MSSDPNVLAGKGGLTIQEPDGNQFPMSLNIQVSPDLIRVVMQSPQGTIEADHVVFANGVLNYSMTAGGISIPVQVMMRQDGNIDVLVNYGGQVLPSVGSRVVDGN
jgi:hypothetical protein